MIFKHKRHPHSHSRRRLPVLALLILILALTPSTNRLLEQSAAQELQAEKTRIAPAALAQIESFNKLKEQLTPVQRKIGSRLFYSMKRQQGALPQNLAGALRTQVVKTAKGDPVVDLSLVELDAAGSQRLLAELARLEVKIEHMAARGIRASVPFANLEAVAALPEVIAVREPAKGHHAAQRRSPNLFEQFAPSAAANAGLKRFIPGAINQVNHPTRVNPAALASAITANGSLTGGVTSQGDKTHRAEAARATFGFNGAGIKIGVLSDGVDSLGIWQTAGELPSVTVLSGQEGAGDEGTAMLQIVHDLAPGAQLFFATSLPSPIAMAQNIRALRAAGCQIIIDDYFYEVESPFQDGQAASVNSPTNGGAITQAINEVTAAGALCFSAAGNDGNQTDAAVYGPSTWEGNFKSNGSIAAIGAGTVHDFGDGGQSNLVTIGGFYTSLHWSDPLGASGNDYDLYVLDNTLTTVLDFSNDTQDGNDDPYEMTGTSGTGDRVVVVKRSGADRYLHVFNWLGSFSRTTTGAIFGHSAAPSIVSVGATPAAAAAISGEPAGPFPNAFNANNRTEVFTSDGPRQLFFNAAGAQLGSGALSGQGITVQKPDLTAADGVATTLPISYLNPFYGTSAAAPHAGAIAALVWSANPSLSAAQVRAALQTSAIDIEAPGFDRDSGYGIVMAYQALQAVGAFIPAPTTGLVKVGDPLACIGTGTLMQGSAAVTNTSNTAQAGTLTVALPATLRGLPNTCTANVGTCNVTANAVNWSGTLSAGQSAGITYRAEIADGVASGAQICVTTTADFALSPAATVSACAAANCAPVGPGRIWPAGGPVNDQRAGSVLIYNVYTSGTTNGNTQNTRISITNTEPSRQAYVHLFFVDGATCSVADSFLCLTANQTATFLASDLDPGTSGYLVAVATDRSGCPTNFNFLIGDEYVKFAGGHAANLAAESIAALPGGLAACDQSSSTATLNFDGVSYSLLPNVLAASNLPSRADGNDTMLIINRIGGNLGTGCATLSGLFGLLYDDQERGASFTFSPGTGQFRSSLSNNFPRTAPRYDAIIPAGTSGWMKFHSQNNQALLGAIINFNSNAGVQAGAFNQGHNLHKLTLTSVGSYVIPVIPSNC